MNRPAWRASIYAPKDGDRYQGVCTAEGSRRFERVRAALAKRYNMSSVSDGDTIEYLARRATRHGKILLDKTLDSQ